MKNPSRKSGEDWMFYPNNYLSANLFGFGL